MINREKFEELEMKHGCGYWNVCWEHACPCAIITEHKGYSEEIYNSLVEEAREVVKMAEEEGLFDDSEDFEDWYNDEEEFDDYYPEEDNYNGILEEDCNKENMFNETIKFDLDTIPSHIKMNDNKICGFEMLPIDLETFINAPITTFLNKEMEENCFYMCEAIGIVTDMKHKEKSIDINVIISPKFKSLWINSKKKITIEYTIVDNKVIISSLLLVE